MGEAVGGRVAGQRELTRRNSWKIAPAPAPGLCLERIGAVLPASDEPDHAGPHGERWRDGIAKTPVEWRHRPEILPSGKRAVGLTARRCQPPAWFPLSRRLETRLGLAKCIASND
jgi:hypothetical protein